MSFSKRKLLALSFSILICFSHLPVNVYAEEQPAETPVTTEAAEAEEMIVSESEETVESAEETPAEVKDATEQAEIIEEALPEATTEEAVLSEETAPEGEPVSEPEETIAAEEPEETPAEAAESGDTVIAEEASEPEITEQVTEEETIEQFDAEGGAVYHVTFDANGGSFSDFSSITEYDVEEGKAIGQSFPAKHESKTFIGYKIYNSSGTALTKLLNPVLVGNYVPKEDITVKAVYGYRVMLHFGDAVGEVFSPSQDAITNDPNLRGGSFTGSFPLLVEEGTSPQFITGAHKDKAWLGWARTENASAAEFDGNYFMNNVPTENMNLYPVWDDDCYVVTYDATEEGYYEIFEYSMPSRKVERRQTLTVGVKKGEYMGSYFGPVSKSQTRVAGLTTKQGSSVVEHTYVTIGTEHKLVPTSDMTLYVLYGDTVNISVDFDTAETENTQVTLLKDKSLDVSMFSPEKAGYSVDYYELNGTKYTGGAISADSKLKAVWKVTGTIPETGLYLVNGTWKYYANGVFTKVTGLVQRPDNRKWYYVKDGIYTRATGLAQRPDNKKWYYVKDGAYTKLTGLVQRIDNGKWFYVKDGVYTKATGLAQRPDNRQWYYVQNGAYTKITGLVQRIDNKKWYYVQNGVYKKVTGLVQRPDNKKWYYVAKGAYTKATGLTQRVDNKKWYYVYNGAYTKWTGVTGRITDGKMFYVANGVYTKYTGTAKDAAGNTYKVTNGAAVRV